VPEYKRIFTDSKYQDVAQGQENFVRVSVYATEEFSFPYLFEFEHGNSHDEDWEKEWSVYNLVGDAKAIRQAIKWLDMYQFKDLPT
jgi:hypothetical protein